MKQLRSVLALTLLTTFMGVASAQAQSQDENIRMASAGITKVFFAAQGLQNLRIYNEVLEIKEKSHPALEEIVIVIAKDQNIGVTARRLQQQIPSVKITTAITQ